MNQLQLDEIEVLQSIIDHDKIFVQDNKLSITLSVKFSKPLKIQLDQSVEEYISLEGFYILFFSIKNEFDLHIKIILS